MLKEGDYCRIHEVFQKNYIAELAIKYKVPIYKETNLLSNSIFSQNNIALFSKYSDLGILLHSSTLPYKYAKTEYSLEEFCKKIINHGG